jgi:hypothetical protein
MRTWLWLVGLALAACSSSGSEESDDGSGASGTGASGAGASGPGAGSAGGGGAGAGLGTCERWGELICDRACECGDDGECAYGVDAFMVHFDSRAECEDLIDTGCSMVDPGGPSAEVAAYWASCSDALEEAPCVAATASRPAHVEWPEECQDSPEG